MAMKALKSGVSLLAAGACTLAASSATAAQPDMFDGDWHFSLSPYLWIPTIYSTANLPLPPPLGGTVNLEVKPNKYLSDIKFGSLFEGAARKGDWVVGTDVMYMKLGGSKSTVKSLTGPGGVVVIPTTSYVNGSIKVGIVGLVGGRTVMHNEYGNLELIAGVRYADVTAKADLALSVGPISEHASPSHSRSVTDGIGGVQGAWELGDGHKWYLPYEADYGGASDNTTYNLQAGVGYRMGWGNLLAGWRDLKYKFSGKNVEDIRFSGPLIAATFQW